MVADADMGMVGVDGGKDGYDSKPVADSDDCNAIADADDAPNAAAYEGGDDDGGDASADAVPNPNACALNGSKRSADPSGPTGSSSRILHGVMKYGHEQESINIALETHASIAQLIRAMTWHR